MSERNFLQIEKEGSLPSLSRQHLRKVLDEVRMEGCSVFSVKFGARESFSEGLDIWCIPR